MSRMLRKTLSRKAKRAFFIITLYAVLKGRKTLTEDECSVIVKLFDNSKIAMPDGSRVYGTGCWSRDVSNLQMSNMDDILLVDKVVCLCPGWMRYARKSDMITDVLLLKDLDDALNEEGSLKSDS